MITKFKIFEKLEIDEKTIRVENTERGWYIDFYFDEQNRLIGADNKWDVKFPDWWGLPTDITIIRIWARRDDKRNEVFYILKNAEQKYNI
jgi:hypothetical protein